VELSGFVQDDAFDAYPQLMGAGSALDRLAGAA